MKFIGQYIQSFIARFRSDVYLEDIDAGTIASGGNLGLDSSNKIVKAQVTSVGTLTGLTVNGNTQIYSNSNGSPIVEIKNTGNNTSGGMFKFVLDKGAAGADNDVPGGILWMSDNDAQQQTNFGEIYIQVTESADGQESSTMYLKVAEYDGTVTSGLTIKGTEKDGVIDVDIASGGQSITTIASNNIIVGSLPTSDPSVAGKLWSDSGTVKVSAG